MFTVKSVDQQGSWKVIPAFQVSYDVTENKITAHGLAGDVEYRSGHIYVMNELGKTVSVYNLDNQKEQKHG